jgi:hypothetical protein
MRRLRISSIAIAVSLVLASCGSDESTETLKSILPLDGSWQLASISCGDQDSAVIPASVLSEDMTDASKIAGVFVLGGGTGHRVWNILGCEAKVPVLNVSYPNESTIRFDEQPQECSASCAGSPVCTPTPAYSAVDYPYDIEEEILLVTIPDGVKARPETRLPCGPGQPTDKVVLKYRKK